MRHVRVFLRRSGMRCLWRGHKPRRTRLAFACRVCRMTAAGLSDFGLMDGGDYVPALRTRYERRYNAVTKTDAWEAGRNGW